MHKGAAWQWSEGHEAAWEELLKLVSDLDNLAVFDPALPATVSVDASKAGIGAVLLQNGKPVEYASTHPVL